MHLEHSAHVPESFMASIALICSLHIEHQAYDPLVILVSHYLELFIAFGALI